VFSRGTVFGKASDFSTAVFDHDNEEIPSYRDLDPRVYPVSDFLQKL
jgi:hypothetical protein